MFIGSTYYYLEYRQPIGIDLFVKNMGNAMNGITFHRGSGSHGYLLTMIDNGQSGSALEVGASHTELQSGITFKTLSATSSGATVSIEFATTPTPVPATTPKPTPVPTPVPTATPVPTPLPSSGASLTDNFDRPDANIIGNGWTAVLGQFSINSGHLVTRSTSRLMQLGTNFGDVRASADFQRLTSNSGNRFTVLIRYQDANNYYYCQRAFGGTAAVYVRKVVQGKDIGLLSLVGTGNSTAPFNLECSAQGNVISVKLNGNPVCSRTKPYSCSVTDSSLQSGAVGIQINGTGGAGPDHADNFKAQ